MFRSGRVRAAVLALALLAACGGEPEGLVDQVEDGVAIVVAPDGTASVVRDGALREGDWVVDGKAVARARERRTARIAKLRAAVAAGDRGGTVVLE